MTGRDLWVWWLMIPAGFISGLLIVLGVAEWLHPASRRWLTDLRRARAARIEADAGLEAKRAEAIGWMAARGIARIYEDGAQERRA